MIDIPFRSKEVSWLSFNNRVLQEAQSEDVPVLERLKFLGIYSSNLDEFFRVRVATLRRIISLELPHEEIGIPDPKKTLRQVNKILKSESEEFNTAYAKILEKLRTEGIRLIRPKEAPKKLIGPLNEYFETEVLPRLMPVMVRADSVLRGLQDNPMYLAVELSKKKGGGWPAHALIEIPSEQPRFHVMPKSDKEQLVMYLDDVIRFGLPKVFGSTSYLSYDSYAVKFTRDAEIALDDDFTESFYEQLSSGIQAREVGQPVRVNYDQEMPPRFLDRVMKALDFSADDSQFPGARYHNRKDLMKFPTLGRHDLLHEPMKPIPHPRIGKLRREDLFSVINAGDLLLYFPYHSFHRFLDLLRQASMDPKVRSIKVTQYRLARSSNVARVLISAVRNGKEVTVLVEPTARFDEEANIAWAARYRKAGVNVILGVHGLKVHAKLCLISRLEKGVLRHYSCLGTGNFNEDTAKVYTDHMLMTANQEIGEDVEQIFRFFVKNYEVPKLKHLICAPFSLRAELFKMIDREIEFAEKGERAEIRIKINNLSDVETVRRLYAAAEAGVEIRMIVRGMFSFVAGGGKKAAKVEAVGIVDKFLEHTRILAFHNGGEPRYFLSSADFLPRNFESRCEILCPVFDPELQAELDQLLEIQWADNVKARVLDPGLSNQVRHANGDGESGSEKPVRSQIEFEKRLRKQSRKSHGNG
ncbi:MAG: polyphosphate kinase [Verrucomicrobiales bacterium]|jgi:polyphosphate kinase